MIVDKIQDLARYKGLSPHLDRAIDWLLTADLSTLAPGKYEISGTDVYCMIQTPVLRDFDALAASGANIWEAHRRYIDIQCPIARAEDMAYAPVRDIPDWQAYDPAGDAQVSACMAPLTMLALRPGDAAFFFPTDAHCPCLAHDEAGATVKLVMKVRAD